MTKNSVYLPILTQVKAQRVLGAEGGERGEPPLMLLAKCHNETIPLTSIPKRVKVTNFSSRIATALHRAPQDATSKL